MKVQILVATALAGLALVVLPALAGDKPTLRDPLPFDHSEHAPTFARLGVTCMDCHPVGLREAEPAKDASPLPMPTPPLSSCHGCHQGELPKAPRAAPEDCGLCHADLSELEPADHGMDWLSVHGDAARAAGARCSTCHQASSCYDCHDRRGAGSENPHPVGFRETHGVSARLDPRSCSSCHTEASCTSCHATGALPW